MLRLAVAVLAGLVAWSAGARADSFVGGLINNAATPMSAFSCIYVDQAATTDVKQCAGASLGSTMAAYFGAVSVNNNGTDFQNTATTLTNLGGAPLASPTLTGVPKAPTAAQGDNTVQIATDAFVKLQQAPPANMGWITGVNPGTACGTGCLMVTSVQQAQNIKALRCRLSATGDIGATLSVYKASSGTACPASGTVLHSGSCNLNGTVNADQTLTLTNTTLAVGDSVCIGSSGVVTNSAGEISMYLTPQ